MMVSNRYIALCLLFFILFSSLHTFAFSSCLMPFIIMFIFFCLSNQGLFSVSVEIVPLFFFTSTNSYKHKLLHSRLTFSFFFLIVHLPHVHNPSYTLKQKSNYLRVEVLTCSSFPSLYLYAQSWYEKKCNANERRPLGFGHV